MARLMSCGVMVTDGTRLLLGHATGSPRWDIPKGLAEPGEGLRDAALRELFEETGLEAPPEQLEDLGTHPYLGGKDLALFAWRPAVMPDTASLRCTSLFTAPSGQRLPELDRFGLFTWDEAFRRVGKNLVRVLQGAGISERLRLPLLPGRNEGRGATSRG